jgi:hypothetical protein
MSTTTTNPKLIKYIDKEVTTTQTITKRVLGLHIEEDLWLWGNAKSSNRFTASNGVTIECDDNVSPGWCNGRENTLFLNKRFYRKNVELQEGDNFKNVMEFKRSLDKILAALKEMETAYLAQATTQPLTVPDEWIAM